MTGSRPLGGRSGWLAVSLAVAALVIFVVPSLGAAATVRANTAPGSEVAASSELSFPRVLWNGQNISGASSVSSAVTISKGQTVPVVFRFKEPAIGDIHQANLQLSYLGVVLTTSSAAAYVILGEPYQGEAKINWSFGALYNALEGTFEFKASLVDASGVTVWSETFYVFAKAPYLLLSGGVVILLLLVVVESYWIATSIREARRSARSPPPTPWKPPAQGTPPAEPGTTAPSEGESAPETGGST